MRDTDDRFSVQVRLKKVTDKAFLCRIEGADYWIPKSQIFFEETEVAEEGDEGELTMSEWIASEKALL